MKAKKAIYTIMGSIGTKDIENDIKNRFRKLEGSRNDSLNEDLIPSEKANTNIEKQNKLEREEDSIDWSWLITTITCIACTVIIVATFIGFVKFSKSRNSWSFTLQVAYTIGMRILITAAIALAILRVEYPFNRNHEKKTFTKLGFVSTFSLGTYLWHNLFTEWSIAIMPVSQYYEPLLIVYYSFSTIMQCFLYIVLLTIFIEIPLRRLLAYSV